MKTRVIIDKKQFHLRPAQQIALSFLTVIVIGALLLSLPISTNISSIKFLDHFFVSTSAVAVTGLTPVVTVDTYSLFGQIVILFLMQIGGLGLMTFIAIFLLTIGGRLGHSEKLVMQEAMPRNTLEEIGSFIGFIIKYTFIFELIGALLLMIRFVPEYGLGLGVFKSIFIAVSAFCNAGFDVIGAASLQPYVSDWLVNMVVAALIIMGGLGFSVWFDLTKSANSILREHTFTKRVVSHLQVHVKLVITLTIVLLASGWLFIMVSEFNNPLTLGALSFQDKLLASFFQSTTLRTAGFSTLPIESLRPVTLVMMMLFMFIGGSPGGTAGGVKTTAFFLVIWLVYNELKQSEKIVLFKRSIQPEILRRALLVVILFFTVAIVGIMALSATQSQDFLVVVFEVFSAVGTVGLSMGLTPDLTNMGKIVIIILMFVGRIGPVAVAYSIRSSRYQRKLDKIAYPAGHVIVG